MKRFPHPDPWAFLSSIRRLSRARVESIVDDAEGRVLGMRFALSTDDDTEPWTSPPSHSQQLLAYKPS